MNIQNPIRMTTNTQFLPQYTLDQLSERVCLKLPHFWNFFNAGNMWEGIIERCQKIEDEPRAVDSVIAEARKLTKGIITTPQIRLYHFILTRVYIILYYRHRDDQVYKAIVFPELKRYMGFYAEEKQLAEIIHVETNKIIELDKLLEEAKRKDVKPVFKFEGLNGDVRDHLYIEYSEEQLFRNMSGVVHELCEKYDIRLDEAEVWYNAKNVVHTLRDIRRPELLIERAVNALTIGQVFEGYKGAQIILLCVYMMVRESPHHEHFDNFINAMESYALNDNSSMRVLKNVRPIKSWLDENLPLDDYDYIGDSALKQETFTKNDMERTFAEYEKKIQSLEEEKNNEIEKLQAQLKEAKEIQQVPTLNTGDCHIKQEEEENPIQELLGTIENKPILSLVWRLMQLDGANLSERGDKKIVQKILEMITGIPFNSCKKIWEVGNRPITRKVEDIAVLNQYMKSIGMKIQL